MFSVFAADTNIGDRFGAGTLFQCMLLISCQIIFQTELILQCVAYCIQTAISGCDRNHALAFTFYSHLCNNAIMLFEVYFADIERRCDIFKFFFKQIENFLRLQFFVLMV